MSLQADLRSQGFCQEDRPWLPHITLVRRWRGEAPQVTVPHASMVVRQISLLRSDQIDGKRIYTELSTNPCVKKQPAPNGAGCFCSGKGV